MAGIPLELDRMPYVGTGIAPGFHDPSRPRSARRNRATITGILLLGFSVLLSGCSGADRDELMIATDWSEPDRERITVDFHRWLEHAPGRSAASPRIGWRVLAIGDDPARAASRVPAVDVLLGGPASAYVRLARAGRLESEGGAFWRVVRKARVGLAIDTRNSPGHDQRGSSSVAPAPPPARADAAVVFDDPRSDPVTLAWAKGRLGEVGGWAEGYARLVRCAAQPRRIGDRRGAALAAIERGEASVAPVLAPLPTLRRTIVFVPDAAGGPFREGVALVRGSPHSKAARDFLRFLAERRRAEAPLADEDLDVEADFLLADLLGATLVDAQDELWPSWSALERAGRPERLEGLITQAPPWPPASVAELIRTDAAGALLETLAEQVAPDAGLRAWLLRSWLGRSRRVDGGLLQELGRAEDGRLCREPRFRAWLRAEWTAWARQRYRRVGRRASEKAVSR